ncbi:uncharacterized protein FIBRA_02914 [Fibroporia radiculosa]|uniref:Enoyl reductase (ER) domain-containing protein n=1 Tax=Fibroporia radiculosa TaxID=599839 RepID=J4G3B4_9APHY|nr:uncharacterized protein FIBRA_02914 [Fibroporia radiculosa]CCM00868.1 predicted protein [Fibroporia radiculosa]
MAPVTNGRVLFNEIPAGYPEPGKTTVYDDSQKIDLERIPLNGGILIKTLFLSIDPYLRGRMRDASIPSYSPAFVLGEPLTNYGVGVVLRSERAAFEPGDHVYGWFPFQQFFVAQDDDPKRPIRKLDDYKMPWSVYTGVCGMPGQTAYYGWKEFANPKPGDVAFVTAGAGPVGSMVIQLAKADGLKVIASAGSEEKVAFIRDIGADVAFNYKTERTVDVLRREGPINVYWDNVGGESLDAALETAATGANFIECGMITGYNGESYHVKNLDKIFAKRLKLFGHLVSPLHPKYQEQFYKEIPPRVARGEFKYTEDIKHGLHLAGHAIEDVQRGKNKGKSVVLVAEE